MNIDQLLALCGDFGRYQWMLMVLFSLINVLASLNYYSQTIITFVPEHWCDAPELRNKTVDEVRAIYANYAKPHCTPLNGADGDECEQWIYDRDYGYESMVSEFNWVCQYATKSTIGQSMFFVGSVVGCLVFGILADRYGRLPVLIHANLMAMVGNGCTVFSVGPWTFGAFRFVAGFATDTNFVMMYILVMEYVRPSMRTFGLNLCIGVFYCVGSMVSPWIAVALGNWCKYLVATAAPVIVVPFFYFGVAESAMWLISKHRVDRAIECFRRVARFNGRRLSDEALDEFRAHCERLDGAGRSANLIGLFRTPRLRRLTLILFFKSTVITLSYDAISRNVDGMGVTPFLMFTLSAAMILPACVVLLLVQDRIGRKAMAALSLLVSGVFTATTGIIIAYRRGTKDPHVLVTLACIGRFGVTMAYNSAHQYATELIPTCVRGQGVAAVHVAGYALTFFSSYILYLANVWLPLPALTLGALCLAGSVLVLFLPETLHRTIPATLAEGEEFGREERWFEFACWSAKERRRRREQ